MMFQLHCTESLLLLKSPRHTSPNTETNKNNLFMFFSFLLLVLLKHIRDVLLMSLESYSLSRK